MYLEQCSPQNIRRNGLVSVFLRYLEYFQNIIILTTNRVTTFDNAFKSRIHFAMKFENLSTKAKKEIWINFLTQIPPREKNIKNKEINDLSRRNINGRQVNCIQSRENTFD